MISIKLIFFNLFIVYFNLLLDLLNIFVREIESETVIISFITSKGGRKFIKFSYPNGTLIWKNIYA